MTNPIHNKPSTASPCVQNCCLDNHDICLGCHRSLAEITGWQSKSENEKIEILARCKTRQENNNKGHV